MQRTFEEFLAGNIVAHPRKMNRAELLRSRASLSAEKVKKEKERDPRFVSFSVMDSKVFLHGFLNMWEKQILTSIIEIQKENWGHNVFFEDN